MTIIELNLGVSIVTGGTGGTAAGLQGGAVWAAVGLLAGLFLGFLVWAAAYMLAALCAYPMLRSGRESVLLKIAAFAGICAFLSAPVWSWILADLTTATILDSVAT